MSGPPKSSDRPRAILPESWSALVERPAFSPEPEPVNVEERLRGALAILEAIAEGELLSATPNDPDARERHQIGISLLAVQEDLLRRTLADLES